MRYRSLVVFAALAAAVSCSDDPTSPAGSSGTFSFTFGGTMVSGSYSATGNYVANGGSTTAAWAVGVRNAADNMLGAIAVSPKASARYDMAILSIDRMTAGAASVDADCDPDGSASCAGMALWFNFSESSAATGEIICGLESGTITVASVNDNRMTGSFSGTGACVDFDTFAEGTFTVTNGSFDVPLVDDQAIALSRRTR